MSQWLRKKLPYKVDIWVIQEIIWKHFDTNVGERNET